MPQKESGKNVKQYTLFISDNFIDMAQVLLQPSLACKTSFSSGTHTGITHMQTLLM